MIVADGHAELSEHLNAYLDRALDAALREQVEAHLEHCVACQLDLDQLRATRLALTALPLLKAPRSFAVTAPATSPRLSWIERLLPWTWRLSAVASALCLLLALVAAVVPGQPRAFNTSSAELASKASGDAAPLAPAAVPAQNPTPAATFPTAGAARAAQSQPAAPSGAAAGLARDAAAPAAESQLQANRAGNGGSVPSPATSPRSAEASPAPPNVSRSVGTPLAWLAASGLLAMVGAVAFMAARR